MDIREFSFNLQKLYQEMSETFSTYQARVDLPCPTGCGRCCMNPEIEASIYEMIPMALKIYDEGKLDEWIKKLENSEQNYCLAHISTGADGQGKCGYYEERPSVCRMFGVAGYFNKHREVTISICRYIKEKYPARSLEIQNIPNSINPPILSHWATKLSTLEPNLIQNRLPINMALYNALQRVGFYMKFQK